MLLNNEIVEVMESYEYLGLLFNYNGNFCQGRQQLVDQIQKAMYALYTKKNNLAIPVDLQLRLFDSLVTPIILYCSEIWGFEYISNIEKFICNFAREFYQLDLLHPTLWYMENWADSLQNYKEKLR